MTDISEEEKIRILAGDDDLLIRLYTNSESARDRAWQKHQAASAKKETEAPLPSGEQFDHPDDVLISPEDITDDPDRLEADNEVDALLDGVDILDAYQRWCAKMTPDPRGKRESIMISCPNPAHPDRNPSAWINTDKQVWVCGACGFEGGDKFDIAAWHFGYPVPGYKIGRSFPELRRKMAEDLGYTVRYTRGGHEIVEAAWVEEPDGDGADGPSDDDVTDVTEESRDFSRDTAHTTYTTTDGGSGSPDTERNDLTDSPPTGDATVTHIFGEPEPIPPPKVEIDREELKRSGLFIDWEHLSLGGTFLGEWMKATCVDHIPDEYLFFMGLQALGFAVGMNRLLDDPVGLVKPGLFVVLYGGTGSGKSRGMGPMHKIISDVLPWPDHEHGVAPTATPGSGEALIDQMTTKTTVTAGPTPEEIEPDRHWLMNDEFAALTAIASRTGSTLKTALMELHDLTSGTSKNAARIFSRGGGMVEARDKFFQVTTAVQPAALSKYTSSIDVMSGFLNRWVFAMGKPRRAPVPMPPRRDLTEPTRLLRQIRDWADEPELIPYSESAMDAWVDFYQDEIAPSIMRLAGTGEDEDDAPDMVDSFMARMELTLKRIMLLLAINEKSSQIEVWHVASAIELAEYLKRSMYRLNKDFVWTFATEVEEAILKYLKRRGPKKPAKGHQITSALKNRYTRIDVRNSIGVLVDVWAIKEVKIKGKRGPETVGYVLADPDDGPDLSLS